MVAERSPTAIPLPLAQGLPHVLPPIPTPALSYHLHGLVEVTVSKDD